MPRCWRAPTEPRLPPGAGGGGGLPHWLPARAGEEGGTSGAQAEGEGGAAEPCLLCRQNTFTAKLLSVAAAASHLPPLRSLVSPPLAPLLRSSHYRPPPPPPPRPRLLPLPGYPPPAFRCCACASSAPFHHHPHLPSPPPAAPSGVCLSLPPPPPPPGALRPRPPPDAEGRQSARPPFHPSTPSDLRKQHPDP